ncbi:sulfur carrier protein ThiS [Pseudodesulfovibrio sediminis]|uniref:Thiamine biosynthesis protein ThiS n=1 Tax=Pseudodesulfovibrio sediminis TaxID=2810563 RepID=A0ABM7P493_9BACT|nr:sulfur carrier protein ThiS [Pseudodesulfovibrio sediminis]BCS87665.1 thiamine biosynthesis protein ThiS [Pseudodesulfovibrio sediminis]
MNIVVNGSEMELDEGATILDLLESKEISPSTVVVERNGEIVPGDMFGAMQLERGDHLEVLRFVGGG